MKNLLINQIDIHAENYALRHAQPQEIIRWALSLHHPAIATTSFGPGSAALLHLLHQSDEEKKTPVVWVDSGYNLNDAYKTAEKIIAMLELPMHIEVPAVSAARLNAQLGSIPTEGRALADFTRIVKLDPFQRAINKLQPQIWINGIHKSDTEHRKELDILSIDRRGILKVAPLFYWTREQTMAYVEKHNLPSCHYYFDPTKPADSKECGLHLEHATG